MNSGIFLINKDKGLSSNKAIQKIKRRLDINERKQNRKEVERTL